LWDSHDSCHGWLWHVQYHWMHICLFEPLQELVIYFAVDMTGFQILDVPGHSVLFAINDAVGKTRIIRIHFKSNRLNVFAKLLVI
jgi:hypothetical protein